MTSLGIELGSTRIKAVLIDESFRTVAQGAHEWENALEGGYWSYSLEAVEAGVRDAYARCAADYEAKHGAKPGRIDAMGVSGMMHGYLAFDAGGRLLVPFRTWRNTTTAKAAAELSELFRFNIPQRWSIAHYRQAMLDGEAHVPAVARLTTIAGYVHMKLCGENVLGVGEASGMFPVDPATGRWNKRMLAAFDALAGGSLEEKLPAIRTAGEKAGVLTAEGAKWLDPAGTLQPGAIMAPPEGDAGTGMVATNSVAARTGNVSAGTSIFAMVVLDGALKRHHPEIDVVTTPAGREVAMVHCNNCTNEINAWAELLDPLYGKRPGGPNIYGALFRESLKGAKDCGGVVVVPYLSGEPAAGAEEPSLAVIRKPESEFTLANFARAQIYSAFVSLKIGMETLREEGVETDSLTAHGGIFKDKGIAQQYLADALKTPVSCMETATEGGPWGMAVLAAYSASGAGEPLEKFLGEKVFAGAESATLAPERDGMDGFDRYTANFKEALKCLKR